MSIVVNGLTRRAAAALNTVGLGGINRRLKGAVRRVTGDSLSVEVDGLTIAGGVDAWTILNQLREGTFEPFERKLFVEALAPGMVVLDIGANVGFYTLLAARAVGDTGAVYAFEPHPRTCASLRANVERNGFENVEVIEAAVSERPTTLQLYMSETATHSGLHRTMADRDPTAVDVPAMAIDDLELPRVDLIKMDIEGEEPAALRGLSRTLDRSPRVAILMEFSPYALSAAGNDAEEFARELLLRFERVDVVDERAGATVPLALPLSGERLNLRCASSRRTS